MTNRAEIVFKRGRPNLSEARLAKDLAWCSDCLRELHVSLFDKNATNRQTGLSNVCKKCKRVRRQNLAARKRMLLKVQANV